MVAAHRRRHVLTQAAGEYRRRLLSTGRHLRGFAEGFVDPKLHVAGNATATAANVVANSDLVRIDVVAHLVDGVFFALTAMALYLLLNHVQKNAARLMVIFVVIAVGMIGLNAVFLFEGMQVQPTRRT